MALWAHCDYRVNKVYLKGKINVSHKVQFGLIWFSILFHQGEVACNVRTGGGRADNLMCCFVN